MVSDPERYRRIKEVVSAAQVARDHGLEVGPDGQGREKALCPYHDDHDPSLKLFADGGFKCFACEASGDAVSLEQHLGEHGSALEAASAIEGRYHLTSGTAVHGIRRSRRKAADSKATASKKSEKKVEVVRKEEVARWVIHDASGAAHAIHIRYRTWDENGNEGKSYSYRKPDGSWEKGAIKPKKLPFYLSELVSGYDPEKLVLVVEGEQAADAARHAGLQVVGTACGTNVTPPPEALAILHSFAHVVCWPDADPKPYPGQRHMARVAEGLLAAGARVFWFSWRDAPEKGDAADHPAVVGGDPEALEALREALREAPAYDPYHHKPRDPEVKEKGGKETEGKEGRGKQPPLADRLIAYVQAEPHELFVDQFGAPHILWERNEPVPLTSTFDHHLRRLCWDLEGKSANVEAVRQARDTLAALAMVSGVEKELHLRAAWVPREEKLYYQLGVGRVVEVDRDGYRPSPEPPVLFRTLKNVEDLPDPTSGGSFDVLGSWVNLRNPRDKRMYIAWLVTAALPHIPRPMLEATGEMGSGKTTASRVAKRTLDPGKPEMVRPDPREFLQKASHAHLVMLDNQNSLPEWAVDTLCRLVTGEADSKRVLYLDDEDFIYEMKRGIILNGINAPTDRGDARDRTLPVELERIPETEYRPEEEMWEEFAAEHPRLLGAVFDTLAQAIRVRRTLRLDRRARLADWSEYAAAVYETLGWGAEKFTEDWSRVVRVQNQGTLEGSSLAQAVMHYMESRNAWEGLATDLHAKLEAEAEEMSIDVKRDKSWPKSSSWLWRRIKEVRPLLTALGIIADRDDDRRGTIIRLTRAAPDGPDGNGSGEDGGCGSSAGGRGSRSEMLPRVLPHRIPDAYADSDERGSSGSIFTTSEGPLSRASEENEANLPQNSEKQADSGPENVGGRKVPRNASTASDAATEGDSGPSGEAVSAEDVKPSAEPSEEGGEMPPEVRRRAERMLRDMRRERGES